MRSFQFVGLLVLFAVFSAIVALHVTSGLDSAAIRYFQSIQGNPTLDAVMIGLTTLDDVITLLVFGIVITVIRRTRKMGLIFLIAIVVIAISTMYIKPLVGRAAPPYQFTPALKLPDKFTLENDSFDPSAAGFSYPSGFIARATALSFIIGFALNKRSRIAGMAIWAFPVIIAVTKLYLLQQYPADFAGGFVLGLIIAITLSNILKLDKPLPKFKQ
jgi:undecaprenyl-diphosphatase